MADAQSCQLYLILEVGASARERLTAAFEAAPVASVLLRSPQGQKLVSSEVKPLVDFVQGKNIAVLIADDASLARTVRADGVHLSARRSLIEDFEMAREIVGRGTIVGVDVGGSRHLAMELGEAGADYIGFSSDSSLAEPLAVEGEALDAELDLPSGRDALIAWWSKIFEVPCVAFDIENEAQAATLAALGADFACVTATAGMSAVEVRESVDVFSQALKV